MKKDFQRLIHVTNLNEDPMLSQKIKLDLESLKEVFIGRQTETQTPVNFIVINGVGIQTEHAMV